MVDGEIPVVGGREPCPCGSGKRYKMCHGRGRGLTEPVRRPFEGAPGECDLVALREIVPAATMQVSLTPEYGGHDVTIASVLPMAWSALRRLDGVVLAGLQTRASSSDPSRDLAAALLEAVDSEPGTPVPGSGRPGPGPRFQDIVEPQSDPAVRVHEDFDFWLGEQAERTSEVLESMEQAKERMIPTERLASVEAAYWCQIVDKAHLRWVLPFDEDPLLDALARLHAAGGTNLGEGTRYIGSFRAHGLLVPVWDLVPGSTADDIEEAAAAFGARLDEALATDAELTADERRARAGVVSRQLTLR
ncbi:MAG: DUF5926 family protein [Actinomycetales bacterium]